jgi:hypothetical protein
MRNATDLVFKETLGDPPASLVSCSAAPLPKNSSLVSDAICEEVSMAGEGEL